MSVNKAIMGAVSPIIPICVPNVYRGTELEYTTFNYSELPDDFGDDSPGTIRYLVQVHYFCQTDKNPLGEKRKIRNALSASGFTYPSTTDASDDEGQHFVFECEYVDGDA